VGVKGPLQVILKVMKIYNGDIYDIGQTVNGISKFIWFNDKWFYYNERMCREYEYDQGELNKLIENDKLMGYDEVKYLGNIFSYILG
jgi:hypothetical protein